jgi:hypothetical protein
MGPDAPLRFGQDDTVIPCEISRLEVLLSTAVSSDSAIRARSPAEDVLARRSDCARSRQPGR